MNPHNYEAYSDPNNGEWIRIKTGGAKDVVWRPFNIHINEAGAFGFEVEFLEGPGIAVITEENSKDVQNMINGIMIDILAQEAAELEALADEEMNVEAEVETMSDELLSHIEQQEVLQGGHKVSEALLPQDVQSDLAQISSVLGGLKPQ